MSNGLLAQAVEKIAIQDGDYPTAIKALTLYRRSASAEPMPCVFGLGLGVAIQGSKRVTLGGDIFDYHDGQSLVTSVDLPVVSHITKASADRPYLGLYLNIDSRMVSQLVAEMEAPHSNKESRSRAMEVVDIDDELHHALYRLIKLLDTPKLLPALAPLLQKEIVVRLLYSKHGTMLRQMVTMGSPSQQIAKVISWLKLHFTTTFSVDDVASRAHMSSSTFRLHFRQVTGMSPLQYIKNLRLQEARQLMMNESLDANSAAIQVGYESASQFSREYTRFFGAPPLRDIKSLRKQF